MKRVEGFLEKYFMPVAIKLGSYKALAAIRDGIVLSMPLIIIGSVFLILGNLPFPNYDEWLAGLGGIDQHMTHVVNSSFGIMGLISVFGIARNYADSFDVDGVSAGVIAISAWLILTPNIPNEDLGEGVPVTYLGSRGLFVAIVVGLLSAYVFQKFINRDIIIKMPESVPPAVSKSFAALIPGAVILTGAFLIEFGLTKLGVDNIHDLLADVLSGPMSILGGTIGGAIGVAMLNSLFWFAGIHGGNMVGSFMSPILLINTDENRLAFQAGEELPHIITNPFFDLFVYIGGGGATLALVTLVMFASKSQRNKSIGGVSFVPGLFNINEPAIFGLPIVFNTSFLIPFALAPMANVIITYLSMNAGLVPKPTGVAVPWTMPPLISGFLATNSFRGALLQVVLIVVDIAIYYPFFRIIDKQYLEEELEAES